LKRARLFFLVAPMCFFSVVFDTAFSILDDSLKRASISLLEGDWASAVALTVTIAVVTVTIEDIACIFMVLVLGSFMPLFSAQKRFREEINESFFKLPVNNRGSHGVSFA
jgi:ABC-type sulfate transport system permease subunit